MIDVKHRGRKYDLRENEYIMIVPEYAGRNPDRIFWEVWLPVKWFHDSKPYIEFESASCHINCNDTFIKLEDAIAVADALTRDSDLSRYNQSWYKFPIKVVDYSTFTEPMEMDDSVMSCLILKYRSLELPDDIPVF